MAYVNLGQVLFPVGSIIYSTKNISPASIYGGTWSSITDGRFMRPMGSWNSTGGETSHKLTIAEMPAHTHVAANHLYYGSIGTAAPIYSKVACSGSWNEITNTSSVGNNAAHNTIPVYRTCYCYYRTA